MRTGLEDEIENYGTALRRRCLELSVKIHEGVSLPATEEILEMAECFLAFCEDKNSLGVPEHPAEGSDP